MLKHIGLDFTYSFIHSFIYSLGTTLYPSQYFEVIFQGVIWRVFIFTGTDYRNSVIVIRDFGMTNSIVAVFVVTVALLFILLMAVKRHLDRDVIN